VNIRNPFSEITNLSFVLPLINSSSANDALL